MPDLSHVVFHLALCRAAVASSAASVPIRVAVRFPVGKPFIDKTVQAPVGSNNDATVELDLPRGQEFVTMLAPASNCGVGDFVTILPDHDRRIEETLTSTNDVKPLPVFQMSGTASLSFLVTTKPTLVAFPAGLACGAPAASALPVEVTTLYDGGAYYLSILDGQGLRADEQPVLALSLHTPSGRPHYIRLPMKPGSLAHGSMSITMNVTDDMVDGVATEPQNVLLCPKIWESSVL